MHKRICIIEPLSSANYLAKRFKEEGFVITAILVNGNSSIEMEMLSYMRSKVDYTKWDNVINYDCITDNLIQLAHKLKDLKIDFLFYGCEYIVELGDKLAELTGIMHNNSATALQRFHKYAMQEALSAYGLSIPKQYLLNKPLSAQKLEQIMEEIAFPLIVKPVNSFASIGLNVVESAEELQLINQQVAKDSDSELKIQEKIIGTEYIVDTFSLNGQHEISLIARYEKVFFNKNFLYRSINPIAITDPKYQLISDYIVKALDAIEFKVGFAHSELFVTEENKIFLIEVNPRVSGAGGTINQLAKLSTGMDQIDLVKQAFQPDTKIKNQQFAEGKIVFFYNYNINKVFNGINESLITSLPSYVSHVITKEIGDLLAIGSNLFDSFLYVVLANDDKQQLAIDNELLDKFEANNSLLI